MKKRMKDEYWKRLKRLKVGTKVKYIFPAPASKNFLSVNCRIKSVTVKNIYAEFKNKQKAICLLIIPIDTDIIINNIKFLKIKDNKNGDHKNKRISENIREQNNKRRKNKNSSNKKKKRHNHK